MGDIIYKPLIDDMVWSYSRLSTYEVCPYMWKLTYIDKTPETKMFYTEFGSMIHRILAEFLITKDGKDALKTQFISDFINLKTGLSSGEVKGNPGTQTTTKYFDIGLYYFCKNLESLENEIADCAIKAVEEKTYFKIGGYNFAGIKDLVLEKDGKLIIVDHKSHNLKPRSTGKKQTAADKELDKYLRQLYLYSQPINGMYPDELWFNCFRTGVIIKEKFNPETYKETCLWATDVIKTISEDSDFEENYNYFFCNYICAKHESCWLWREERNMKT